jgi:putative ATPase
LSWKAPLAERIRPKTLEDYIGQSHLVGPKGTLTLQLQNGILSSMILWGPPGVGKTTLAEILAETSKRPFFALSAINSGVKDVREIIEKAKGQPGLFTPQNPIVFIDEIHRFSKSQQDSLLGLLNVAGLHLLEPLRKIQVLKSFLHYCQDVRFMF